ncbi:NADH-quinone oxidoreductase subunit C/D [Varanus komodoensis]|nr:NADH-quinone oxidoreductase subunit C/D [Varanus komodoensis]
MRFLQSHFVESGNKNSPGQGYGDTSDSVVAEKTMVYRSLAAVQKNVPSSTNSPALVNTTRRSDPPSGYILSEADGMANHLVHVTESVPGTPHAMGDLTQHTVYAAPTSNSTANITIPMPTDREIQAIIESALRPSTRHSYTAKWRRFSSFAECHLFSPATASVTNILQFLLHLHHEGHKPSSIKVYAAAMSHYRGTIHRLSVFSQPLVRRFIKGLQNLHPSIRPAMPTWSLSVVLQALTKPPFKPLATADLRLVSWKTAFLVAVTSARRASELCALRINPPFLNFHKEKVVLRMDFSFLPKGFRCKTSAELRSGLVHVLSPSIIGLMYVPDGIALLVELFSHPFFDDDTSLCRVCNELGRMVLLSQSMGLDS